MPPPLVEQAKVEEAQKLRTFATGSERTPHEPGPPCALPHRCWAKAHAPRVLWPWPVTERDCHANAKPLAIGVVLGLNYSDQHARLLKGWLGKGFRLLHVEKRLGYYMWRSV